MQSKPLRIDVFCKIVDNFGDIGICWRLSQQLHQEYGLNIQLYIDDFAVASLIIPNLKPIAQEQRIKNIHIAPWPNGPTTLPDVVIENFSCNLPAAYRKKVAQQQQTGQTPTLWINLEYLSAEKWVEGFHLQTSTHPTEHYQRTFYYPGFTKQTGGLLREGQLIEQHQAWQTTKQKAKFWQQINIDPTPTLSKDVIKISLFCYTEAEMLTLIDQLQHASNTIQLFIPSDRDNTVLSQVKRKFKLYSHNQNRLGNLVIHSLPFFGQDDYDQLLSFCDLNFVRGEDSWIRALWSGKPFIWQPYIQEENTHLVKLTAFLEQYCAHGNPSVTNTIKQAHLKWSNAQIENTNTTDWLTLLESLPQWLAYSQQATAYYAAQPSLSKQLLTFIHNQQNML